MGIIHQFQTLFPACACCFAGDTIVVFEKLGDGWWSGEIDGRNGIFPSTYVQEVDWALSVPSFRSLLQDAEPSVFVWWSQ